MTDAPEPVAPRPRRVRSATESLLAITLGLEAMLVFFVTLTFYGLRVLEPAPAFIGGGVLLVALVTTARFVRFRWGVALGWVLQVVLVATGFLLPVMFFIGAGFAAIWIFCVVKGRQLDRPRSSDQPARSSDQPEGEAP